MELFYINAGLRWYGLHLVSDLAIAIKLLCAFYSGFDKYSDTSINPSFYECDTNFDATNSQRVICMHCNVLETCETLCVNKLINVKMRIYNSRSQEVTNRS